MGILSAVSSAAEAFCKERENFFFDGEFARVSEFETVTGKNFDAVVGPGIVRRGNDDAGGQCAGAGEVGHAGSGDHAGAVDIDADGGETFGDAVGDPGTGFARVLADYGLRLGVVRIRSWPRARPIR